MRSLFMILIAILIPGCTSDSNPTAPSAPGNSVTPLLNLTVLIKVSGAASTGETTYSIKLDGETAYTLQPNVEARFTVPAGNHTILLAPPARGLSWCSALSPSSFSGSIRGDSMTYVTFSVSCPPLVGTGTLQLSLSGSGSVAPDLLSVTLTRINGPAPSSFPFGPPLTMSFGVSANKPLETTIPVGLYRIAPGLPANCLPFVFPGTGIPYVAIRDGVPATVSIAYSCA